MQHDAPDEEFERALNRYLDGNIKGEQSLGMGSPSNAALRVIYDFGWVAAMEGKAAMACPYFETDQHEKFNAWMDGYHDYADRLGAAPPARHD